MLTDIAKLEQSLESKLELSPHAKNSPHINLLGNDKYTPTKKDKRVTPEKKAAEKEK